MNLSIGSVGASLQSPPSALAGSSVPVTWSGPNNEYDRITIALPTDNPEAAIERLRQSGVGVHVNIVGFAIDDKQLRATFRFWSEAGGGKYFDAKDASGLDKAFRAALASSFEMRDGEDHVVATGVVGGETVRLMPGEYRVRSSAKSGPAKSVSVRPKETARVEL